MVAIAHKRNRVGVLTRSEVSDSRGDMDSETWAISFTRWASVDPLSSKEFLAQDRTKTQATHRIRMRFDASTSAITSENRLRWNSTDFEIIAPPTDPGARNREVVLLARVIE